MAALCFWNELIFSLQNKFNFLNLNLTQLNTIFIGLFAGLASGKEQESMSGSEALVRCRYSKCGKTATVAEAKKTFKTCHNCAHVYWYVLE